MTDIGIEVIKYNNETLNPIDQNQALIDAILATIQPQIDGQIMSWFYDYDPTLDNEPAVLWLDNNEKNKHLGDLFYNNLTGLGYRFSSISGVYSWELIRDTGITAALAAAAKAQSTADGKIRTFITPNPNTNPPYTPTGPYDIGDLWLQGTGGDLLTCINGTTIIGYYSASDWSKGTKYTDDTTANTALAAAQAAAISAGDALAASNTATTNANIAYNLAIAKTKNYVNTGIAGDYPLDYHVGDTWTDGKVLRRCISTAASPTVYVAGDWAVATSYIAGSTTISGGTINTGAVYVGDNLGTVWGGMQGSVGASGNSIALWFGNPDPTLAPFRVDYNGNVVARSGTIGGWQIGLSTLYSIGSTEYTGSGYNTSVTPGITLNSNGSIHANNFYINTDGSVGMRGTLKTSETGRRIEIRTSDNTLSFYYSNNSLGIRMDDSYTNPYDSSTTSNYANIIINKNSDSRQLALFSDNIQLFSNYGTSDKFKVVISTNHSSLANKLYMKLIDLPLPSEVSGASLCYLYIDRNTGLVYAEARNYT